MDKKFINFIVGAMVVVFVAAAYFVFVPRGTKVGLFEYVRKADKYFEEKKYSKGLMLLHKAFEEMPDSEKVKERMLFGYVKYSSFLEEKGKLDEAIDYLLMAFEMDASNLTVANNLAYLYGKKAVRLSKEKEHAYGMDYIKRASEIAMRSKTIRRNLSAYLYNSAVKAFDENDGKTVFICLNFSYLLNPRFDTLNMFAHYFYRERDLAKAKFYWEKAGKRKPGDKYIAEKLEMVDKELKLKEGMRSLETANFDVQFNGDYDIDPAVLKEHLSRIYDEVGADLKCYPSAGTPIVLYTEKDFREIFKQKGIVRAFYDGSVIRLIFNTDIDNSVFPGLIAHEYTHAILSILTENNCPIWLHEGLAVLEQSRYISPPSGHLETFIGKGGRLNFDTLEKGFLSLQGDLQGVGISYEGSFTAVLFIIERWGWEGLSSLIGRISEGQHYINAIDEEFFVSEKVFVKMWNEYVKESYMNT